MRFRIILSKALLVIIVMAIIFFGYFIYLTWQESAIAYGADSSGDPVSIPQRLQHTILDVLLWGVFIYIPIWFLHLVRSRLNKSIESASGDKDGSAPPSGGDHL